MGGVTRHPARGGAEDSYPAAQFHVPPAASKAGGLTCWRFSMLSTRFRKFALTGASIALIGVVAAGVAVGKTTRDTSQAAAKAKIRIGFVLPDLANPVIAGFRDGAVQAAKKRGWQVLVKG